MSELKRLRARIAELPPGRRLIALAGPPASGKSHLTQALCGALNADQPGRAAIVAMDGFHYDDLVLEARGHRARKGAPHTFDVDGLSHLLMRLRSDPARDIAVPIFDRDLEIARAGAAIVPAQAEIILVEGNYLLLDAAPWDGLAQYFDLSVMIHVPEPVLRARLEARWQSHGADAATVQAKLDENDLPNGRLVLEQSRRADLLIDGTAT